MLRRSRAAPEGPPGVRVRACESGGPDHLYCGRLGDSFTTRSCKQKGSPGIRGRPFARGGGEQKQEPIQVGVEETFGWRLPPVTTFSPSSPPFISIFRLQAPA